MHQMSQQGMQKNFVSEFPIFSTLKLSLYELVIFIDMDTNMVAKFTKFIFI